MDAARGKRWATQALITLTGELVPNLMALIMVCRLSPLSPLITLNGSQGFDPVCTRQVGDLVNTKGETMHYLGIDVSKAKQGCCLLLDVAICKHKTKYLQTALLTNVFS